LWDIDHTLIENNGVSKETYAGAFELLTGRIAEQPAVTEGRTDPEIMRDLLIANGVQPEAELLRDLPEALASAMKSRVERLRKQGFALPGTRQALTALNNAAGVVQSVVTGNIQSNAFFKLSAFDLTQFLDLDVGGYGSDAADRSHLVDISRRRVADKYGVPYGRQCIVVIGDTPRDVRAGFSGGAYVIGVATGSYDVAALLAEGADIALSDLSDTDALMKSIINFRARSSTIIPTETSMSTNQIIDSKWAFATAQRLLASLGNRWKHVQAVGERARLIGGGMTPDERELLVTAALLHDIGYAPELSSLGFHPLDGARWLRTQGATPRLCSLVAHHSCASIEAEERGLSFELETEFPQEDSTVADALTCADMTVGPTGLPVRVDERLDEILTRYPEGDMVNRAVRRSSPALKGTVRRAEARLGFTVTDSGISFAA
jgi:phosphoglycolate phosphatase-like HAD superfamily hydrolase/predicted hydrolase (HD superfamily)